ncbi:MAG: YIP1 family protein [Acidobacteriota bacterium]
MEQPENQIEAVPTYSAPVAPQPEVQPEEPAQMNWFQRLIGVLLSPTETFTDVNRKPTIIAPMIIVMALVIVTIGLTNWKLGPFMDDIMRAQIKKQLERQNVTLTEEQMAQQMTLARTINKFMPFIGAAFVPIIYLIIAGLFALGMMMIQAKATFKKIYSVVLWTFAGLGIVGNAIYWGVLFMKDEEALRAMDVQDPTAGVPTNLAVFLDAGTSPAIKALAGSMDIISFWTIAVLSIGLAAIAGSKKIKPGKTAMIVIAFWAIYVIGRMGLAALRG